MKLKVRYNEKYKDIQFLDWEGTDEELETVGFTQTRDSLPFGGTIDGYIKGVTKLLGEPKRYGDIIAWGYERSKAHAPKVIGVSLPRPLWNEIDKLRGDLTRSAFIRNAVEKACELSVNRSVKTKEEK